MVVIDPISLAFGAANMGMGIMGGMASQAAQQQEYVNQRAFQDANNKFAMWQAGFNARVNDANNQYKYWAETVNYNQGLAYTNALRNVELLKAGRQADVVGQTRAAAGSSYLLDSEAISQQFAEASMQEAVAMQQYRWRALQNRASVQALNQEGKSVDRLVNDYARQVGDYETLQAINQGIRGRQYTREQAGRVAQYLSQWNNQQFYEEQGYIDPIPPFAPLPTLIQPGGPSMTGSGPSSAAGALNIGTAVMGGVNSAFSMQSTLNSLKVPSSSSGSGTPKGS
jgi:hypothetical protein